MERSIIPSVEKKDIIRKLKWEVNNRLIVPCYEDQETISMGERLVPHEQFSMRFPFDTSLRGALSPFAILYRNFGYYGLDQEGYDILAEYLNSSDMEFYINHVSRNYQNNYYNDIRKKIISTLNSI